MKGVDRSTQTEEDFSNVPHQPLKKMTPPSSPLRKETEQVEESPDEREVARIRSPVSPPSPVSRSSPVSPVTPDFPIHEEPAQIETAIPVIARAVVVNVPKRVPPILPPRNPNRDSPSKKEPPDGFEPVSASDVDYSERAGDDKWASEVVTPSAEQNGNLKRGSVDTKSKAEKTDGTNAATEDEFHSVPPSPTKDSQGKLPGAF